MISFGAAAIIAFVFALLGTVLGAFTIHTIQGKLGLWERVENISRKKNENKFYNRVKTDDGYYLFSDHDKLEGKRRAERNLEDI